MTAEISFHPFQNTEVTEMKIVVVKAGRPKNDCLIENTIHIFP